MSDATTGFKPVCRKDARVVILGSMPGKKSIQEAQYYAHPRNVFWRIMGALLGLDPDAGYDEKLLSLQANHIALWDVLKHCERQGSLDSAIKNDSLVVNNFSGFFNAHPHIHTVFFNGKKAAELYRKHAPETQHILIDLPSTSPANAGMTFVDKLTLWSEVRRTLI